jgi:hypothetical protein
MNIKRLVIGTVVGSITLFVLGYLIFDLAFAAFYAANTGSATSVARATQVVWAVALGSLSYAALITLAIGRGPGSSNVGTAVKIGAVVGFLLWFTADFIFYGIQNVSNLTRTVVDPLLELVRGGVGGGVIAVVLGRIPESGRRENR